ncbi:uncharacterized protein TrAtP1_002209 [Trichoderma atroviride]|uniref:uncharacterized protein n=1 Tax=Hypocrea atroviridis TaxID=63577 RepID=UPI003318C1CB|nr:hypothetical protein TrAtP1_002209 [Trichoderma atroviride]
MPQAFKEIMPCILDMMPGSRAYEMSLLQRTWAFVGHCKKALFGSNPESGPLGNTQVFLIMSHDGNQATLCLKDDKPYLEFQGVGKSDRVKKLNDLLERATASVGGTLSLTPFYNFMSEQLITAHPLG